MATFPAQEDVASQEAWETEGLQTVAAVRVLVEEGRP